jgi:hypothetical protein
VRDDHRIEFLRVLTNVYKALKRFAAAQTGIDQDARLLRCNEGGVSRATAGENADLDDTASLNILAQKCSPHFLSRKKLL